MTTSQDVSAELAVLAEMIAESRRRLEKGEVVDIVGLPDRAEAVCKAIADLPSAEGRSFEDRILTIISQLDLLAEGISKQQKALSRLLGDIDGAPAGGPDSEQAP